MKLSNLKRASDLDVKKWLAKELKLGEYQKEILFDSDFLRDSNFYFYEEDYNPGKNLLWRFSIIFYAIYYILMICFLPIKWVFTGKYGYGRAFIDNFHTSWMKKIGLK